MDRIDRSGKRALRRLAGPIASAPIATLAAGPLNPARFPDLVLAVHADVEVPMTPPAILHSRRHMTGFLSPAVGYDANGADGGMGACRVT
jgi:hypothetical protein